MKKTRILSLILSIVVIFGLLNFPIYADNTITAYITISVCGDIVKDKNGVYVAEAPVTLSGKESYTLDDAFYEAHELYYSGGAAAGYATYTSEWGAGIAKAWGDTSGKFGYQMNLGTTSVWGLDQVVSSGDYIDLCIYENYYPDTESYAIFDAYTKNIEGDTADFTLYESYYGPNWETLFKPCAGATIVVDGTETAIVTDANGECTVTFNEYGKHIVSAKKTKVLVDSVEETESIVSAITAPVCIVNLTVPDEIAIIDNIVAKCIEDDITEDANFIWLLADIMAYKNLYPNSTNGLSKAELEDCIEKLIDFADEAETGAELAKAIIGFRALGYDADKIYKTYTEKLTIVEDLAALIDAKSDSVKNIYTLPYVAIAMREYANAEQSAYLLKAMTKQKASWQDDTWGVDAATPMVLALSPYYNTNNEVKEIIDETVDIIESAQSESGAIGSSAFGDSAASTGLAIAGLSAIGIDPATVKNSGNSLISGLISFATEDSDGFLPSSFDNEQGLRGLIAWRLSKQGKSIFDFSSYPKNIYYDGAIFNIAENDVLDIGDTLNFRNGYINATNGHIKAGDRKITGNRIYFTNSGKMRLEAGYTAKVERDNGDGTTDQGFMVGMTNPHGVVTMILGITGTANEVDYTGKTISKEFNFTDYEVSGLVNFGFTVTNIPKPLALSIQSIE